MEVQKVEDVASVKIFTLCVSEGELQYFADSLSYVLRTLDDEQLYRVFNEGKGLENPEETRAFAEGRFRELMTLIKKHCDEDFLEKRFRDWRVSKNSRNSK